MTKTKLVAFNDTSELGEIVLVPKGELRHALLESVQVYGYLVEVKVSQKGD